MYWQIYKTHKGPMINLISTHTFPFNLRLVLVEHNLYSDTVLVEHNLYIWCLQNCQDFKFENKISDVSDHHFTVGSLLNDEYIEMQQAQTIHITTT